jgi:hypothetical protein
MSRGSGGLAATAFVALAMTRCASHAHTNAGALHNLRECPLVAAESTGAWQRTDAGGGFFVRLPADCAAERAPSGYGRRWRCGAMTVDVARGQWGEKAFREGGIACRATLGQVPVAVFTSGKDAPPRRLAWYLDGHGNGPHPVVTAWAAKGADPARLEAVVRSGTFDASSATGARR